MSFRKHRKQDLLNLIINAISDDGWNILYLHDPAFHPFILRIFKNGVSHDLTIYIWNLTHGGGSARAADEYRIQITGVERFENLGNGKVMILGWWEEGGVFAGFDFNYHNIHLGASPSIQIRESALRNGYVNGISAWEKGNSEIALAIRPDFLTTYIDSLNELHSFGTSNNDLKVLESVVESAEEINEETLNSVTENRREIVVSVKKKVRDNSFKNRILTAYSNRCAFCGIQLKLIDAAHIVPVEHNGTDDTSNGIALCAIHHRSYDRRLVKFNGDYSISTNTALLDELQNIGLDGGRENFINNLRAVIHLPPTINDRPHRENVETANTLRGW
ncbi:HNH endonuclease [Ekhidna sp.]|uniref:HNH endonuclease n=1 Tax=Ekhidna sp. TaxID=2608089 RepID=UPI003CCBC7DD